MKYCVALLLLLGIQSMMLSQGTDTTQFKVGGTAQLNFSQASFVNWSAGGENNIAVAGQLDLFSEHIGSHHLWRTDLRLAFGQLRTASQLRKSDDIIQLVSTYKRAVNGKFSYNANLDFRSQFAAGYKYPDDSTMISNFLAPAFLVVSTGFEYRPASFISVYLSPLAGKFTYVRATDNIRPESFGVAEGQQFRAELGATFRASINKDIMENVTLVSDLELFSNYLQDPQNIDINWLVKFNFKINKFLAAALTTQLLYDHDILIPKTNEAGESYLGRGTQFRQVLNIGINYTFQ
jgi:hypothetical protein